MEVFDFSNSKIIFITGGTKSGKSEFAEYILKKVNDITYIALSEKRIDDENWQKKVSIHQKRRPDSWKLVETENLMEALKMESGNVLIDSIGGFIMENINKNDEEWGGLVRSLIMLMKERVNTTVIVGEQVGWSLVSEYEIGNKYIERIGELQKRLTQISQENWLTINGRAINLDNISFDIPK